MKFTATELSQLRHNPATASPFNQGMKKRMLIAMVAVAVLTAGAAVYFQATAKGETPQFMTATVTRGDVVETVDATGTLQAVTTVQVGTQVSGTIQSLFADFNTQVKKGQVVARLDPSLLQAQVDQAEATVTRLQADVERARVDARGRADQAEARKRVVEGAADSADRSRNSAGDGAPGRGRR